MLPLLTAMCIADCRFVADAPLLVYYCMQARCGYITLAHDQAAALCQRYDSCEETHGSSALTADVSGFYYFHMDIVIVCVHVPCRGPNIYVHVLKFT